MTLISPARWPAWRRPANHAASRAPVPTATSAPTSERTIEWQNASATTVMSMGPGAPAVRRSSTRCRLRIVVAPSR